MQAKDLRELSEQELSMKEQELVETVFRLRLRRGTAQLDKPADLKSARRDIARIKTVRSERTRAGRES